MIIAQNLRRTYGNFLAVNDVSFSITKGEIVGLLGHNGAGKTTIMKMLTGYLEPTAGEVIIDGKKLAENRLSLQQKIGYLPENCPVYPELSVIDYLEYVAELRGIPEDKRAEAIRGAIQKTKLESKACDPISTLSKGFRQRVGIAQAIIHSPEFLIMDEPTSGLDPSQIQDIRSLIQDLSKQTTIILSTHILQEVEAVCNRVIIIANGELALDSKLDDLQSSRRLMVSADRGPKELEKHFHALKGILNVALLRQEGNQFVYRLELAKDSQGESSLTSQIAKTVMDNGGNLFALQPERRDLEAVFREINQGEKHAH